MAGNRNDYLSGRANYLKQLPYQYSFKILFCSPLSGRAAMRSCPQNGKLGAGQGRNDSADLRRTVPLRCSLQRRGAQARPVRDSCFWFIGPFLCKPFTSFISTAIISVTRSF